MSNAPADRRYARSHEWLRELPDDVIEIGITDHAQHALGDLVFVELPQIGRVLSAGEACAVVESVKSASDILAPLAGTVVAANAQLGRAPELVNHDPYGAGWILRLKLAKPTPLADFISADEYRTLADKR